RLLQLFLQDSTINSTVLRDSFSPSCTHPAKQHKTSPPSCTLHPRETHAQLIPARLTFRSRHTATFIPAGLHSTSSAVAQKTQNPNKRSENVLTANKRSCYDGGR